jgi:hypothetical protein
MEAVQKSDRTILPHPSCSPELVPCDFHLSPKMKEYLCGHLHDSGEEVERTLRTWMKKHSVEFFRDGFEKLVHYWQKCMENGGDYVEK